MRLLFFTFSETQKSFSFYHNSTIDTLRMRLKSFKWGDNARMKNESEQRRNKINVKKE